MQNHLDILHYNCKMSSVFYGANVKYPGDILKHNRLAAVTRALSAVDSSVLSTFKDKALLLVASEPWNVLVIVAHSA